MAKEKKTVGIIGGMGPMATADLMYNIISQTKAEKDGEHVHVIVDNDGTVPDRTAAILRGGEDPLPKLCAMAKKLEEMGADMLVMPCNTAHYFHGGVSAAVNIPVVNMLDETARSLAENGAKEALLLATDGTVQTGIYEKYLSKYGVQIRYMSAEGQARIMSLIYDCIKAGKYDFDVDALRADLIAAGADKMPVILGCTELPIAFRVFNITEFNTVDPSMVVARALVLAAGAELK